MSDLPYSHKIAVASVPAHGTEVVLEPDAAVRAALARHAGLLDLPAFRATLKVMPEGADGAHVTGRVTATTRQTCVVTLEAFDSELREDVDVHFSSDATDLVPPEEDEEGAWEPPDLIEDGAIDLGALATEFLCLGVDPYPRKPGAVFELPDQGGAEISPFAALARLKKDV